MASSELAAATPFDSVLHRAGQASGTTAGPEPSYTDHPVIQETAIKAHGEATRVIVGLRAEPRFSVTRAEGQRTVRLDLRAAAVGGLVHDITPAGLLSRAVWSGGSNGVQTLSLESAERLDVAGSYVRPPGEDGMHRIVLDLRPAGTGGASAAIRPAVVPAVPGLGTGQSAPEAARDRPVVVIDAGHGGIDPGAIAVNGLFEKDVTLRYALALKARLEANGGYTVRLTRDSDRFIALRDRVAIARAAEADFFISLHADANPERTVRGASVYTLSERASDREADRLAETGNRDRLISGVDLSQQSDDVANILIDLAVRETVNASRWAANIMVDQLEDRGIRVVRNSHRSAGFVVLKAPDVPSLLVELGYLSNDADADMLADPAYEKAVVTALNAAIDEYFERQYAAAPF